MKYLVIKTENVYGAKGFSETGSTEKFVSNLEVFGLVKEGDEFHYELEDYEYSSREELEGIPPIIPVGLTEEEEAEFLEDCENMDVILVTEGDRLGGEDGYTNSTYSYSVREITDADAKVYKKLIKAYNAL